MGRKPIIDLETLKGKKFGRLTILGSVRKTGHTSTMIYCFVQCDCGKTAIISYQSMRRGYTKSCGCLQKERKTHGLKKTKIYRMWKGLKARCYNKNNSKYRWYGGRGIRICDEWKTSFKTFVDWAYENGYKEGLSLERKNVNEIYCPENCCWIPLSQQNMNKTNTHWVTLNGETKALAQWCKEYKIDRGLVGRRIRDGWEPLEALTLPKDNRKRIYAE